MDYSTEKIKNYLLGNLSEVELDEIALQIISGSISEENLLTAEHDLIEDYLEKSLLPAELELFHTNFLAMPERKRLVSLISVLKNYAQRQTSKEKLAKTEPIGFFRKVSAAFSLTSVRAVFALTLVGVFIGIFYFVFLQNSTNENSSALEQEIAKINRDDLTDIEKYKDISNISLISGKFRGAGETNKLQRQNLSKKVLIRLAVPNGINSDNGISVIFIKDGNKVFTQNINRIYKNQYDGEIRFFVPSDALKKGVYEINVKSSTADLSELKYRFSVD